MRTNCEGGVWLIDAEPLVFSHIAAMLGGVSVSGEINKPPTKFPHVLLFESDNSTYTRSLDADLTARHATLTYEAQIYSNKVKGKKSECRKIANQIGDAMAALGFVKTFQQPVHNLDDATVYRIVARYRGVISEDGRIYHN